MAGAGGTTPLRLKDLLELDCDSCSAAGFQCYPRRLLGEPSAPTMRRLLASPPSLRRGPSKKKLSHLSRSLSRRLLSRGGLFRRRQDEDDDACGAEAAPSGGGSESSSETTTTSDSSCGRGHGSRSRCESDSDFSTATSTTSSTSDSMDAAAAAVNGNKPHEAVKRSSGSSSGSSEPDDKEEQLSPVAVMDFPSDDDEGEDGERDGDGACSPSFSLARLQRRKMLRAQYKIRRFESTEELGPVVDLETLMAATSDSDSDSDTDDIADDVLAQQQVFQCRIGDTAATTAPRPISRNCHGAGVVHHETHEHDLLHLLMDAASACVDHVSERLLFNFLVEMKRRRGRSGEHSDAAGRLLPREAERLGDDEVLEAARGWLDGAGSERWGLNDVLRRGGEAVVAEMERPRRWMQVREEEREVGAVVAGMLADQLVDEMVWDLLV